MGDLKARVDEVKVRLGAALSDELASTLREGLGALVGTTYHTAPGIVADDTGARSAAISALIHASEQSDDPRDAISVNDLAIAIEVIDQLNHESLAQAYAAIVSVKVLAKRETRVGVASHTNATLGIIYARQSAISVEDLAEQLQTLNQERSSDHWPDIVCIGDQAILEYCVQFPGHPRLSAWFPASPGAFSAGAPSVYVVLARVPTGADSFSRVCGQIFKFLSVFRTDADLPIGSQDLSSGGATVLPSVVYQYDLSGQLRPLRQDQNRNRIAPDAALLIVDQHGEPLSTLRYMEWQDGSAIVAEGKFPLEGLLIFAPGGVNAGVLRPRPDLHISYVLSMDHSQFIQMLAQFQERSNLKVEYSPEKWIVRRMSDEGTASPYVARLMLGILTLRDAALPEHDPLYARFDVKFERVSQALASVRASADAICALWADHEGKVRAGQVVRRGLGAVTITASIDRELRREVEAFLIAAARLLKLHMQELASVLGLDLSFLFKQRGAFNAGIAKLAVQDAGLAAYLEQVRETWSERLILTRIRVEHDGWTLPAVEYRDEHGNITAQEPEVAGERVTKFVAGMRDRLCCFVEDITAHLLAGRLPRVAGLSEVPIDKRPKDNPARFELVVADGGRALWQLEYSDTEFLAR